MYTGPHLSECLRKAHVAHGHLGRGAEHADEHVGQAGADTAQQPEHHAQRVVGTRARAEQERRPRNARHACVSHCVCVHARELFFD